MRNMLLLYILLFSKVAYPANALVKQLMLVTSICSFSGVYLTLHDYYKQLNFKRIDLEKEREKVEAYIYTNNYNGEAMNTTPWSIPYNIQLNTLKQHVLEIKQKEQRLHTILYPIKHIKKQLI